MILYFSGTGNSRYAALRIAEAVGDEAADLFYRIKNKDYSPIRSDRAWVIAVPTYAWRIPRIVENWMRHTCFEGSRDVYFVLTCGGNIANAGSYAEKLCDDIGMNYMGCAGIVMPENYIALFRTPAREESLDIIARAESVIDGIAGRIAAGEKIPRSRITLADRFSSGPVNTAFYPIFVHAKKFRVTDKCISCGRCAELCPLENIVMNGGRPSWGDCCTHCMACICRCPNDAIEYGKHSVGQPRYTCPKQ